MGKAGSQAPNHCIRPPPVPRGVGAKDNPSLKTPGMQDAFEVNFLLLEVHGKLRLDEEFPLLF